MDDILEMIMDFILIYPGAYVRWILFHRGKNTFEFVVQDKWYLNSLLGALIALSVIGGLSLLFIK